MCFLTTLCKGLTESMTGLRPRKGKLRQVFRLLKSQKTSLRFPFVGFNKIINYFSHPSILHFDSNLASGHVNAAIVFAHEYRKIEFEDF